MGNTKAYTNVMAEASHKYVKDLVWNKKFKSCYVVSILM